MGYLPLGGARRSLLGTILVHSDALHTRGGSGLPTGGHTFCPRYGHSPVHCAPAVSETVLDHHSDHHRRNDQRFERRVGDPGHRLRNGASSMRLRFLRRRDEQGVALIIAVAICSIFVTISASLAVTVMNNVGSVERGVLSASSFQ